MKATKIMPTRPPKGVVHPILRKDPPAEYRSQDADDDVADDPVADSAHHEGAEHTGHEAHDEPDQQAVH